MTSWLTDGILLAALAFTSWRTLDMARELRCLRSNEGEMARALREADVSINRAAEAVVMLRSDGIEIVAALDARIMEAREMAEELDARIRVAERRLSAANDTAERVSTNPRDTWLGLIESRFGTGSSSSC